MPFRRSEESAPQGAPVSLDFIVQDGVGMHPFQVGAPHDARNYFTVTFTFAHTPFCA